MADVKGVPYQMGLEDGNRSLKTPCGVIVNLIALFVIAAYTSQKMTVLLQRSNVNTLTTDLHNYYPDEYEFSSSQGLSIAMGVIDYFDEDFTLSDPTYGQFMFQSYSWGIDETTGQIFGDIKDLASHQCTREELGLTED